MNSQYTSYMLMTYLNFVFSKLSFYISISLIPPLPSRIDDATIERVEELVLAAEELPAIKETLKELGQYARANKIKTVALTDLQVTTVRDTFQCLICRG